MIKLYHHPFSRAAGMVWSLEEVGQPYELVYTDLMKGEHKTPDFMKLNPMGKLPVLVDGDAVISEGAAINMYLGDRYGAGKLAPAVDDPRRGTYLRWSFFPAAVIEPGLMAKREGWEFKASAAGWGDAATMLDAIEVAIGKGPYLLGEQFTMVDITFGGTLRFMLQFGMLEKRAAYTDYVGRLNERPAMKRADAKNMAIMKERGLQMPGQS